MADPSSPTGVGSGPVVVVSDEQSDHPIDASRWAELAGAVLADHQVVGELTLSFVDRAEMAELNTVHMGASGPTDVLAFPLDTEHETENDTESDDESADGTSTGTVPGIPVLLGDVVICPSVAAEAAADHAGTFDDELALLTVHGLLHVLGHDHADPVETAAMRAAERHALEAHHWRGAAPDGFRHEHAEAGA